ncbi:hypothetical protein OG474_00125 [Kribbella sp. NBC_01505]|uniref:hypothetical protein n=1 Tax=Kribbella sp. NBC_01505 TaxID=2903580 RepID=UPI00386432BB
MKRQNGVLAVVIAAITVAAVALGAALASRQSPNAHSAAPLAAPATPQPTKLTLAVDKLGKGQPPRLPYLVGREVRGAAGDPFTVPGADDILEIARVNDSVLAITTNGDGWRVQRSGGDDVLGASHLQVNEDHTSAAYAAYQGGTSPTEGGIIFADSGTALQSLKLTTGWNFQVLAYANGKVYYQSSDVLGRGATWSTYAWVPGEPRATLMKTIPSLTTLTADGKTAASTLVANDAGSCSAISTVDTGQRAWKTCDYSLRSFSPAGATVFGTPARDQSSCATAEAALDAKTGQLLREWKGCLQGAAPEDDDHLLMVATVSGADSNHQTSAIVRCTVSTGACELATAITADRLLLGS